MWWFCNNLRKCLKHLPDFLIDEVADDQQRSVLFESLSSRGQMQVATGFTKGEIQGFHQIICPLCVLVHQAGAHPRSSWLDMVVCYLAWAKLGCDYLKLSIILGGISASQLEDNIKRIRPILKKAMFQKWFDSPAQPRPLMDHLLSLLFFLGTHLPPGSYIHKYDHIFLPHLN
jgi:hypothetical protein